jgi:hypothetical protein
MSVFTDETSNAEVQKESARQFAPSGPWLMCRYSRSRVRYKTLGGLTPAKYAKQPAIKAATMPENSKARCYRRWGTSG